MAARIFDRVLEHRPVAVAVYQPCGEDLAERRPLVQRLDLLLIELILFHPAPDLAGEILGQHPLLLQRPEALQNDSHRKDRADDDGRHQVAAGFDYLNHKDLAPGRKNEIYSDRAENS